TDALGARVHALCDALTDVAERSFFAMAEPCDRATFDDRALAVDAWRVAVVSFRGDVCGTMQCALTSPLGESLFDAFTGRGADEPAPRGELTADLIGEFANMVCGAWLTRLTHATPFVLGQPRVVEMPEGWRPWLASPPHELEVTATIDDQPVALQVHY